MKSSWSPTEFDQNNRDVTSIPGYVIKKSCSRGAKHGPSEPQKNRCFKRPDRESTDTIQRYFRDGMPVNRTETRCMTSGGEKNTFCYTTESLWRSTSTSPQELREFKIRSLGFSRQMQKEELSNHSINDPTLLKRKENANDCMTSTWQVPKKNTEPSSLSTNKTAKTTTI